MDGYSIPACSLYAVRVMVQGTDKVQIRSVSVSVLVTWCRSISVLGVDVGGIEDYV
jgi:hypothetical protein